MTPLGMGKCAAQVQKEAIKHAPIRACFLKTMLKSLEAKYRDVLLEP